VSRFQLALIYILAAVGLNLALGYAGEVVLGHSVIIAAGAYGAGIASEHFGLGASLGLAAAVVAGTGVGMLMMLPGIRVKGWYLTLITFFAILLVTPLSLLGEEYTGGEFGLTVDSLSFAGEPASPRATYAVIAVATVLVLFVFRNFVSGHWGLRLRALRDAPRAAQSAGLSLSSIRLTVYVLSALPAAIAGGLLAYAQNFVNPESFGLNLALLLITGVVLGGKGTFWGPVIGMLPLLALTFWLGPFSPFNAIIFGVALLVIAIAFPDGIVAAARAGAERWAGRGRAPGPTARTSATAGARQSEPSEARRVPGENEAAPAARRPEVMLAADDITMKFGGAQVLTGVRFRVPTGSLTGLVGPNGSGKSTLLNIITGYLEPSTGTVSISGERAGGLRPHEIAKLGVGRTFQVPQLVPELTVVENITVGLLGQVRAEVGRSLLGAPGVRRDNRERSAVARRVTERIGLAEVADVPVAALSLGLKRIVEVGRAAVADPALMLLDEPAAGLDKDERERLSDLLSELCRDGITIVVVEHNVPFILRTCDEVILLRDGQVECHVPLRGDQPLPEALAQYLSYIG